MSKCKELLEKLNKLEEGSKPSFGNDGKINFAVNIETLDSNEFYKEPFGRQLSDLKKIKEWKTTAKKGYVGAKGKPTMKAVKEWVKNEKPKEFYATWQKDSSNYKDDTVEIFYKK